MGGALPPAGDVGAPPDFGGMPDDMADAGAEAPPVEEPPVV